MKIEFNAINLINGVKAECITYSQDVCRKASSLMVDDMVTYYKKTIDSWYMEYTPKVYKRHEWRHSSSRKRGMYKSFKRIYKNPHDAIYTIGIDYWSPETMYQDYNISSSSVLDMFLKGWHGSPELKFSSTSPLEELKKGVDLISNNFSYYLTQGEKYAQTLKQYQYIYF